MSETPAVVLDNLPFADYLALPGWGSSTLKAMRKGPPARVLWQQAHAETTDAMRLGSAVHAWMLSSQGAFDGLYAHKPDGMSFATKEGKAWREEQSGKVILTHGEWTTIAAIAEALSAKALVEKCLLERDGAEVTLQWTDLATGEACKGRPDWMTGRYIYDLKVSRHAAGQALAYRAYMEGWMHQLAHYRSGATHCGLDQIDGGRLVVVTPTAPHFVYTLEVKRDSLDLLQMENEATLAQLGQCRDSGIWPGTPDEWTPIEPPPTALISSTVGIIDGLMEGE